MEADRALARLQAENARLRAALLHRCVIREIQEQCEDCRDLIALLDPTADDELAADDGRLLSRVGNLEDECERLRNVLAEIARQATQGIDTQLGGQILRQIEIKARAALAEEAGSSC